MEQSAVVKVLGVNAELGEYEELDVSDHYHLCCSIATCRC